MSKKQFRPETTSEHIARDMREGRFPEKSPVQMVPVEAPAHVEPVAWVIPGDDNAKCNGFLDAMAHEEEEFSQPLYAHPPTDAAEIERLTTRLKEEMALYAETDGKRRAAEDRAEKAEAERDAALAQVAALREVVKFHERLTVDPSTLSRRDAQMRAEGRKEGLRLAAKICTRGDDRAAILAKIEEADHE